MDDHATLGDERLHFYGCNSGFDRLSVTIRCVCVCVCVCVSTHDNMCIYMYMYVCTHV